MYEHAKLFYIFGLKVFEILIEYKIFLNDPNFIAYPNTLLTLFSYQTSNFYEKTIIVFRGRGIAGRL